MQNRQKVFKWDVPNYESKRTLIGGKWIFFTQWYMSNPFYPLPFLLWKEEKYFKEKSSPLNKVEGLVKYLLGNFEIKFYHSKKRL